MKAAVLEKYGVPTYRDYPEPDLADFDGCELVDVHAATINNIDIITAAGTHFFSPTTFPVVAGIEGAGVTADGTRVYFGRPMSPYGSMAEKTVVNKNYALPIPDALEFPMAATLGNAGMAAAMPFLDVAPLRPGNTVAVLGASGVVGRLAVQIAGLLGAETVIAVGRDAEALEETRDLGATGIVVTEGLDADEVTAGLTAASGGGVDVIVDYTWGPPALAALAAGNTGVRLVQIGESAADAIVLPAQLLRAKGASVTGFVPIHYGPQAMKAAYSQLTEWSVSGSLRVDYISVPLADVADAWDAAGRSRRKLVLEP